MIDNDDFEWDQAKAESNLRKHKISFRRPARVCDDAFALVEQDLDTEHDEDRYIATGMIDGVLVTVVFTERGARTS